MFIENLIKRKVKKVKKMRKNDFTLRVNTLVEKAMNTNCNIKPMKTVSSGLNGSALEGIIKVYLNNVSGKYTISRQNKVDTIKKVNGVTYKIEIKSGCSEIGTLDENGNLKSNLLKSDLIMYCPQYENAEGYDNIYNTYVIPTNDFIEFLQGNGFLRLKKSTSAYRNDLEGYDRVTIQSFKNSKRKSELLYDFLYNYPTIVEWYDARR